MAQLHRTPYGLTILCMCTNQQHDSRAWVTCANAFIASSLLSYVEGLERDAGKVDEALRDMFKFESDKAGLPAGPMTYDMPVFQNVGGVGHANVPYAEDFPDGS